MQQVPTGDWALCQRVAGPFGPLSPFPCSCTHPQAQHTTDVHWVTLLALQSIHARTSLWRSSTTSASLLSPCHGTEDRAGVPALVFPTQHCLHPTIPCGHSGLGSGGCAARAPRTRRQWPRGRDRDGKQTKNGSYRSAWKANFSLHPCSSMGALEGEERGQECSVHRRSPIPPQAQGE